MLLSEFVQKKASEFQFPQLKRQAIVQAHCHHKSIFKTAAEEQVLKRIGIEADVLDSGCCGMAGPFGFETSKFEVSQACGERVLLPAVREASADDIVIADGFSCREQIRQNTHRYPLHLAEVIKMALKGELPKRGMPEAPVLKRLKTDVIVGKLQATGWAAALVGTAGLLAWAFFGQHRRNS